MKLRQAAFLAFVFIVPPLVADTQRDLALDPMANNQLLLVGVSHGLPGIDKDLKSIEAITSQSGYPFAEQKLWNQQGTVKNVADKLTTIASKVDERGTFFFYFSGHGSKGSIYLQDRSMTIEEIRSALEKGRATAGPLARLVLMFDSCFSGSLIDPLRAGLTPLMEYAENQAFADALIEKLSPQREAAYWNTLFVFASSRANETSGAGSQGSTFTVALKKGFDQTLSAHGTMADWVAKTKSNTFGHHPVERFSPADIANEKMVQ